MGYLQLTPKQLANLTLREFFYKVKGFFELQQQNIKVQYETARLTATLVLNSFTQKQLKPTDVIRFTWEEKKILPKTDKELFNRRLQTIKEREKKVK